MRSEHLKIGSVILTEGHPWEFEPRTVRDIWPVPDDYYNPKVERKLILDNGVGIDDWFGKTYHTPDDYPWLSAWLADRNNKRSASVATTGRAKSSKRA